MEPVEYARKGEERKNLIAAAVGLAHGLRKAAEESEAGEGQIGTGNRFNLPRSTTLPMLIAMNKLGKHIYPGTVDPVEIQNRREKNRVARRQRRVNRLRGA